MASGPVTSWQIDGETVETVADFNFGGSKIIADGDYSHGIKRRLFLERKVMTNLDSMLKSRDITLPTKVHLIKAMVFPVVVYGCESWTIKKAEHWRIDAFELWCWRRLLRVSWTGRRSNQSILKEVSHEYSLTDADAETPILWPPNAKNWLIGKHPDAGKDWRREEKGMTEDEMVGWHHWLNGHEFLSKLWEFTQTHVHRAGDAIQPSHPLSSPSPPALNLSQHQGVFQWVNSSYEVAKVLQFQLQHQSFQWTPRTDLL